jgi:hypothetical protein
VMISLEVTAMTWGDFGRSRVRGDLQKSCEATALLPRQQLETIPRRPGTNTFQAR